ncbi:MAG: isopeptide-forming domain-containing fimbrial protein [Firmicutes bacterium]|nr:isopeptide-forming domain-containing fimbrial protein [Bacillota bacterium]
MFKMKRIVASVLSLAMALGMTLAASAEEGVTPVKPSDADKAIASVSHVEKEATVKAYQIVEAEYNEYGFVRYAEVEGVQSLDLGNATQPTSDEVAAIVKNDLANLDCEEMSITATTANGLATFSAELAPGYWIVLVNGAVKIYNPMLVGVYYSVSGSENTMATENVNATTDWKLVADEAWGKSALPTIDKSIVNSDGNTNGNDVAVGDTVEFKIDTVIPSYSAAYEEVIVTITDELSAGLALNEDSIEITIGGDEFTPAEGKLTTTAAGFTLDLSDVALENSGEAVVINYTATVDTDFAYNFAENTNEATLTYTNNPTDKSSVTPIKDKTYTYTFGIDGLLNGENSEITKELFKVNENGDVEVVENEVVVTNPLKGATFKLTNDVTGDEYEATSVEDGSLTFTGLDCGTYTLIETAAPAGYSVNEEEHEVVISATYNEDGTLATYTITIDNEATSTYEDTATGEAKNIVKNTIGSTGIVNTKLIALPGTGGIGTTIFTVVGCAVMVGAAFLFFMNRKKEESK